MPKLASVFTLLSVFFTLVQNLDVHAQTFELEEISEPYRITAFDLRTNAALNEVSVKFKNQIDTLYTDQFGVCQIQNLALFPDSVSFHKEGYSTGTFYLDGSGTSAQVILQTDYSNLQEVYVYGFSTGESLATTPAAVQLIKAQEIQQSSMTNVAPILNKIPGVFVQTGALNTNRITIRGVGGRSPFATKNIRAYLEDIPLTDSGGETALEDIDLETIGSIEVIKGPTSSLYGSGTGGTIIMNAAKADINEHSVSSRVLLGSYSLQKLNLTYRFNNEQINAWAQLNNLTSDGYRDNNSFERTSYSGFVQSFVRKNKSLSLLINRTEYKAFIPSSLKLEDAQENPQQAAFIWGQAKGFERYLESLIGVNWKGYHKKVDVSHSFSLRNKQAIELRPWDFISSDLNNFQWRSVITFLVGTKSKLHTGYEYMREVYDNEVLVDQVSELPFTNRIRTQNLFLSYKTGIFKRSFLELGVNNNRMKFRGNRNVGFFFSNRVTSPQPTTTFRAALSRVSKSRNHTQYLSFNTGLINPSIEQIFNNESVTFAEDVLNLRSEKSQSTELGFRGNFGNFNYDLVAYAMRIKDRIDESNTSEEQIVYANRGESIHQGIEAQLNWKSRSYDGFIKRLQLSAGGNYGSFLFGDYVVFEEIELDSGAVIAQERNHKDNVLTGVPDLVTNLEATLEFSIGLNLRLHYQHVGTQALNDENVTFSDPHDEVNLNLDYSARLSDRWSLNVNAGIRNLLDADYYSMYSINAFGPPTRARYYYPALPINFFSGLKLTYHLK